MNRKAENTANTHDNNKNIKPPIDGQDIQPFGEAFFLVNNLPVTTRGEINQICDWSIPTFYRKLKAALRPHIKSNLKKGASRAQSIAILDVYINNLERALAKLVAIKAKLLKKQNNIK